MHLIGLSRFFVGTSLLMVASLATAELKRTAAGHPDLTGTYDLNAQVSVNQLNLGDDEAVRLGDSQDFQLFHRASDNLSIISESGSGYLSLQSTTPQALFAIQQMGHCLLHYITHI